MKDRSRLVWQGLLLVSLVAVLVAVACSPKATSTPTPAPTATATATKAATPTTAAPTATPTKAQATPTAGPTTAATKPPETWTPTGTVKAAVSNTYYLQGSPSACPSCSLPSRVGVQETLFEAQWDASHNLVAGPQLAQTWTLAPDMLSATVTLTKGVKFYPPASDPTANWGEMTADDVVWTWNQSNPRQTPATVHDTGGDIAAFLDHAEKIDDYTVKFVYHSIYAPAQIRIFSTFWESPPVFSKKVFEAKGDAMKDYLVGTGPFVVDKWVLHDGIYVNAVPNHWRKTPYIQRLEMTEVLEGSNRRAALETGAIDMAPLDPKDQPPMLQKGMKQQPEGFYSRWAIGFAGNFWETTNPLTKQPVKAHTIHTDWPWVGNPADPASMDKAKKVRQAMALDIDRDSIAKSIMQGIGRPFYMYELSTDDPYWQDKWKIPYDPAKAKQLMKEAGYENGFTFQFRSDPASLESEVTQALASTWLADLNIKTNIQTIVYSTFRPTILDQTAIPWFCGDGVSTFPTLWPKGLTLSSISSGGYNCAMEIPALSKTFMDANTTQDPVKLKEIAYQFYDYLAEERLVVGVAEFPGHAFYNPKRIVEWKMRPEGKGTGYINSPEWIKLAP